MDEAGGEGKEKDRAISHFWILGHDTMLVQQRFSESRGTWTTL